MYFVAASLRPCVPYLGWKPWEGVSGRARGHVPKYLGTLTCTLASLGVLMSTVPVTRNMVPPYHLRQGGKTALEHPTRRL